MTAMELLKALGEMDEESLRSIRRLHRRLPGWRVMMKKTTKFALTAAAVVLVLGFIFTAWYLQTYYGAAPAAQGEKEPIVLRVLTEYGAARQWGSVWESPFLDSVQNVAAYYEAQHENVTVQVDVIPNKREEREAALKQLRTEILSGNGPDVYLLPCGRLLGEDDYTDMEELFWDVRKSMGNAVFRDIGGYYDNDELLNKDGLNADIMNAGVLDGKRYVLPLGYNLPVVIADSSLERLERTDVNTVYQAALDVGDPAVALGALEGPNFMLLNLFPQVWDYDADQVLLTEEELVRFFSQRHELAALKRDLSLISFDEGGRAIPHYCTEVSGYLDDTWELEFLYGEDFPLACRELALTEQAVGIAKSLNKELSVAPLYGADGTLAADVTYWGAVDSHCGSPAAAYDFLRLFLTPEVQFQQGFEGGYKIKISDGMSPVFGWPVLTEGSLNALWKHAVATSGGRNLERRNALREVTLEDSDLPVLSVPIDHVRFPTFLSVEFLNTVLEAENGSASIERYEEMAQEFLRKVQYHLDES